MNRIFQALCIVLFSSNLLLAEEAVRIPSQSQIEDLESQLGISPSADDILPLPKLALAMIKHFEGWEERAYDDPNYCTIGYGHLIALKKCSQIELGKFSGVLPKDAGEKILLADTKTARHAVLSLVEVELNENQFGALTSFVFNVGKANFERSTLLILLNAGDLEASEREFYRWNKSKGKVFKGLVKRRECEASVFRGEIVLPSSGVFSRNDCSSSLGGAANDLTSIDIELGE